MATVGPLSGDFHVNFLCSYGKFLPPIAHLCPNLAPFLPTFCPLLTHFLPTFAHFCPLLPTFASTAMLHTIRRPNWRAYFVPAIDPPAPCPRFDPHGRAWGGRPLLTHFCPLLPTFAHFCVYSNAARAPAAELARILYSSHTSARSTSELPPAPSCMGWLADPFVGASVGCNECFVEGRFPRVNFVEWFLPRGGPDSQV